MTYHTLRAKIVGGSVSEKREALEALRGRESEKACQLLILASNDLSTTVVLSALVRMRSVPFHLQHRFEREYERLSESHDDRVRWLSVNKLSCLQNRSHVDVFLRIARTFSSADGLESCEALIALGLVDEVRALFRLRSPDFVFKCLVSIASAEKLIDTDIELLKEIQRSGYKRESPLTKRLAVPGHEKEDVVSVNQIIDLAVTQIQNKQCLRAFDEAIAQTALLSQHLPKHFERLAGTDRQVSRSIRHIRKFGAAVIEALLQGTNHPASEIRSRSMLLLSDLSDDRIFGLAFKLLEDSDIWVRDAAVEALGKMGDARAIPLLVEMACSRTTTDHEFSSAYGALESIVAINPKGLKETLLEVYTRTCDGIRPLAVEHLARLNDSSLVDDLERILWDDNEISALNAMEGLAVIGTPRCWEIISLRKFDQRVKIRERAETWLGLKLT